MQYWSFMFHQNSLENKIQQQESKIKELEIHLETLEHSVAELLNHLQVTPEQLTAYVSKQDHFTEENWDTLQKHKLQIEEKLQREIANIRNPAKLKKSYSNLHVERHWLHVR